MEKEKGMKLKENEERNCKENKEISLDDLEMVSGGSLGSLPKRETTDISDSVKGRA